MRIQHRYDTQTCEPDSCDTQFIVEHAIHYAHDCMGASGLSGSCNFTCAPGYEIQGSLIPYYDVGSATCVLGEWRNVDVCVEINECEKYNEPCENGGTCVDLVNTYECECLHEYHGVHCNSTHDDCSLSDEEMCGNGVCVDLPRAEYGTEHFNCTSLIPCKNSIR